MTPELSAALTGLVHIVEFGVVVLIFILATRIF